MNNKFGFCLFSLLSLASSSPKKEEHFNEFQSNAKLFQTDKIWESIFEKKWKYCVKIKLKTIKIKLTAMDMTWICEEQTRNFKFRIYVNLIELLSDIHQVTHFLYCKINCSSWNATICNLFIEKLSSQFSRTKFHDFSSFFFNTMHILSMAFINVRWLSPSFSIWILNS